MARPKNAWLVAALVLTACSRRGCACAAGYAPEVGVADLDPLALEIWLPDPPDMGHVQFALGAPDADAMCPRLPKTATMTWNGVPGEMRFYGGPTGTKRGETLCRNALAYWRDVPAVGTSVSTVVVDDGAAKVTCTVDAGLPLRLASDAVDVRTDKVPMTVEAGAEGVVFVRFDVQVATDGELAQWPLAEADMRADGRRLLTTVPASLLKTKGGHRLVVNATLAVPARCTPPRKASLPSQLHVTARLPFTVR